MEKKDNIELTTKKYVRLRKLSEIDDSRLGLIALLDNGLNGSPQSAIKVTRELKTYINDIEIEIIIDELNEQKEMDPDKHDGSYEYVREVLKSLDTMPVDELDNKDLNLLYFATIGTFRSGYNVKMKNIDESNLSLKEKDKLKAIFNEIYGKAKKSFYENTENFDGNTYVGMFGTGIGKIKVSDKDSRKFINLCIKISKNKNEDENINFVKEFFYTDMKYLGIASLSQILHCLKPNTFPILNGNTIDKIFGRLGIKLINPNDIRSYGENTKIIRNFRNENFKFKNYRQLDKYFQDLYSIDEKIIQSSGELSKEDWVKLIKNKNVFYENDLNLIKAVYDNGGQGSSAEVSIDLGFNRGYFNLMTAKLAKRITKQHKMDLPRRDDGTIRWWNLIFDGKNEDGKFLWLLKPELREAIEEEYEFFTKLGNISSYTKKNFLEEVFLDEDKYDTIVNLINRKKNIILQGAPGVGKTYMAKRLAYSILGRKTDNNVETIQFHQSYSYEDFIQGIRPNEEGGFIIKNGVFYDFCKKAEDDINNDYFFIIDEINRGNISKIFGELMMLLEGDKRGLENKIPLLYTEEYFSIPENLYFIGTMNTADRSLAILDYALRRRFSFISLKPAFSNDKFKKHLEDKNVSEKEINKIISKIEFLNDEIEKDINLGKGFKIGHSYFCNPVNRNDWYDEIIQYDIAPLLEEYWFDDEDKAQQYIEFLRNE